jgi:hypothetical protein
MLKKLLIILLESVMVFILLSACSKANHRKLYLFFQNERKILTDEFEMQSLFKLYIYKNSPLDFYYRLDQDIGRGPIKCSLWLASEDLSKIKAECIIIKDGSDKIIASGLLEVRGREAKQYTVSLDSGNETSFNGDHFIFRISNLSSNDALLFIGNQTPPWIKIPFISASKK